MDYFELIRTWFNFAFDNPEKVKPNHIALYVFCVEHCNRLGWKPKFGLPTTMAKDAIGIRSYNTYKNTLNDLVDYGFITMLERSKNQYSSNIIALSKFNKAQYKALDKALIKHSTKQRQSIDSIIKQVNNKQYTKTDLLKLKNCLDKKFKKDDQEIFSIVHFDDPSINEKFIEYLNLRKSLKVSNSELVINRLKRKLREYSDSKKSDAIEIIEKAITSNWKDFYPLKN